MRWAASSFKFSLLTCFACAGMKTGSCTSRTLARTRSARIYDRLLLAWSAPLSFERIFSLVHVLSVRVETLACMTPFSAVQ